jgi:propanol-preferring alcohol dehydrogenase
VTRQQRGYRLHRWGHDPVWERFDVPVPRPGQALVEVEACGIGLTVLNLLRGGDGKTDDSLPRVPGHELVGRVVETGAAEDREWMGRRVTAYFYLFCGSCPECTAGLEDRCRNLAGLVGADIDGGYAPFTVLPVRNLVPLPDHLDPVEATVIADAVATPVHISLTRARLTPFDRVAVIGAGGGVGIHLVQVARLFGARVAGLDVTDAKLTAIEELGAEPIRSDDLDSLDPHIWPDGAPTAIVDFVGRPETVAWAQRAIERGGRIVLMTSFKEISVRLEPWRLVEWEAALVGSRYATRAEVRQAAELVGSERVRPIIGLTVSAAEALEVHRRLRSQELVGRGAIRWD